MFSKSQEEYLLRRLQRNEVVLFVGAGFSLEAKNRNKENLPTGSQFSEKIWKLLSMPGDFDGTSLQHMYELLLSRGMSTEKIKLFLEETFLTSEFPSSYEYLNLPFWHKIYTTNIDDLLEKIIRRGTQRPEILKYPKDEYKEVDKSLDSLQLVYLNGKLPCEPSDLIFSKKQYAKTLSHLQPLYHQFVSDYSTTTTIFLGTAIDEPIFEQYIAQRETRSGGVAEFRPQSFLIDPYIPPAKELIMRDLYNIEPVRATTLEFLSWLKSHEENFLSKQETLKITFPQLAELYEKSSEKSILEYGKAFNEFSQGFSRVNAFSKAKPKSKYFLLGTSPTWNDIFNNLDAPRKVTALLYTKIEEQFTEFSAKLEVLAILGSAGCGKSTILKRLSLQLAQNGRTVFLSYSEYIPDVRNIVDALNAINEKVVLVFDNADLMLNQLPTLVEGLKNCNIQPLIVVATRTNIFDRITSKLGAIANLDEVKVPNLDRDEIITIIQRLEENNLLGHLKGMTDSQRISEFEQRSKKQILVAMREATKGENFDVIIKGEFDEIEPSDAKYLAACIALTTEAGFTISKQDLVGFSNSSPADTLFYLERNLRDIVLKAGPKDDRLLFRHRSIAEYVINNCLDIATLKSVYLSILSSLAPEINVYDWQSRKFALYKEIINHYKVYKRFKSNIELARDLYDSLIPYFNEDYQFWLQFGSLEMEGKGGSLELAENYLNQANSLRPNSLFVQNAMAHLFFKKALFSKKDQDSSAFREEANRILHGVMLDKRFDDAHTYHIYCKGNYNFIIEKLTDRDAIKEELLGLKRIVNQGVSTYPSNSRLNKIKDVIEKAYLLTGTSGKINFPQITFDQE